jgi:hypothetical protein
VKCYKILLALLVGASVSGCGGNTIRTGALPVLREFYSEFQRGETENASKHICAEIRTSFLVKSSELMKRLNPGNIRINTHSLGSDIGEHYAIVYLEGPGYRKTMEIRIEKIEDTWKICPDSADDLVPNELRT